MSSSMPAGFLGRSSGSNSNMRGLVQFIADLRNARARELEEKRINKELANIRYVWLLFWMHGSVLLTQVLLQTKIQRSAILCSLESTSKLTAV